MSICYNAGMTKILSGIQPSGTLHLGNYFGAIKQFITRQEKGDELFIFIADWHAITTVRDGKELQKNIRDVVLAYLACGLDPEKVTLYRQSDIKEIPELAWVLSCLTPMGLMERAHSYKDKIAKGLEANVGLFSYPVLMAADILIMQPEVVPVGRDQKQHVEIARDLAGKFNNNYGEVFVLPDPEIKKEVAVVPGIDGQKMSKSYGNTIPLFASDDELMSLAKKVVTDSAMPDDPKNPEEVVPFVLLRLINPEKANEIEPKIKEGGMGYGDLKNILGEELIKFIKPIRDKKIELEKNIEQVDLILEKGAERARDVAQKTLEDVRNKVGLNI